ncbi:oligosaccharide flippase family protein [uncultured Microbacterium sp.]|uniref:lipopolysaccharide biosynthesis protein n=1 Tax=uncultured Microbacterium sp. TaxID=191216 RepID=UPI0025E987E5|nr:oligosaccharide flippase family protein [uncultured Microbacterium sp.]
MILRFSISMVGRVIAALLQVAIYALFARILGVQGFGVFATTTSLTLGLMTFAEMGMGARLLRGDRTHKEDASLTTFGIVRAIVLVAIVPISIVGAALFNQDSLLVTAAAVYVAGEATGDLAVAMLQGAKQSVSAMIVLCVRRVLVLLALVTLPASTSVYTACFAGGTAGVLILGFFVLKRRARPRNVIVVIRENLGIIVSGGASSASQFDTVIVGHAAGTIAAGLYGSATRLFNPINLAVSTMLQTFVPEISSADSAARIRVFKRVRLVVLSLALAVAISSMLAPALVNFLYGEEFAEAAPVAIAVFLCASLSAVAQVYMAWYYATSMPRCVPILMWASVLLGLAGIWLLSGYFGILGAAVGLFALHLLSTAAVIIPWRSSLKGSQ